MEQFCPLNLDVRSPPNVYLILTLRLYLVTLLSRASLIVSDLVVIAVTWATMYRSSRLVRGVVRGPTFHQVMLQNGSIYFVVLVSLNALHITLTALSIKLPLASESYVTTFIDPVTSILISRFLLNLRETSEQPEVQGASSFNADGGYSPELPSFLGSLGPTHSAPEPTERTSGCNNKATYSTAVLSQTQVH
ncbi:hypothetical protein C8Q79DRAFT_425241 [Trametes meyenii]|nr:hypothetical protein C8Q79DRAFT_425241 [Trametes meyenii]